jgi:hypothetical protein
MPWEKLQGNAMGKKSEYTNEERTVMVVAENMQEISYVLNYLNDSKLYLYVSPSTFIKTKIPTARYLNYHMHNYFNNVYILKERMTGFLQKIKKSSKDIEIRKSVASFNGRVEKFFEKYGTIRHEHTHRIRYIDRDISRLESFEGAYSSDFWNDKKIIKKVHVSMAYSEVKKAWLEFMKTSNESISRLVSEYFDFIIKMILGENGSIRIILRKLSYE